jgi:hypothetical protein
MARPNLGVRRYVHRLIHLETGHAASLRHDGGFELKGVVIVSQSSTDILRLDAGQRQGDNSSMRRFKVPWKERNPSERQLQDMSARTPSQEVASSSMEATRHVVSAYRRFRTSDYRDSATM